MIRCYVGIIALGMTLFSVGVSAQTRSHQISTGRAIWDAAVNGKTTTVGGMTQGQSRVYAPYKPGTVDASGNVALNTGPGNVNVNGKNVPVDVGGTIGKGDIANAAVSAAGCAVGGGGVAGAVVCGGAALAIPLALNWMANAGVRVNPTTKELEKSNVGDPSKCFTGTCYTFFYRSQAYPTLESACKAHQAYRIATFPTYTVEWGAATDGSAESCYGFEKYANGSYNIPPGNYGLGVTRGGTRTPDEHGWSASSIADAVGLMNNSRIPNADIVKELDAAGQADKMPASDIKVTGPASVQGPSSTTINNTNNTTTTTSTTNNYTYNNNTVTNISNVTTSTTTRNSDGTVTNQETTTQTPGNDQEASTNPQETEESTPTDSALPPVPSLYERKYPNGMEGIWSDYKDQLKGTDLVSLVGKLMPNVGDGGSCPTWMINLDLSQWASYGTHDVAPACWIWDVAKAILILSALLLARSLVFGG